MSGDVIRVLDAAISGCNTSRDVADVTGLSIEKSASYVSRLISVGALRKTGRFIDRGRGRRAQCFEPTEAHDGRT